MTAAKKNSNVSVIAGESVSNEEARRIALFAQGLCASIPNSQQAIGETVRRLGLVQLDSVNVLVRSHYLPFFSRLGMYDREWLANVAYSPRRQLFEYWGHEASLLPLESQPLLRWRMARARAGLGTWKRIARFLKENAVFVNEVMAQLRDRGPLGAGEIGQGKKGKKGWWEWSDAKIALESLFWIGEVTTSTRKHFERIYDLTDRVLPAELLNRPTPAEHDAQRELTQIAARALGIATETDLRDYFRLGVADARRAVAELVEEGTLLACRVEGWRHAAFLHRDAVRPQSMSARALLSPFDSLVWERSRTERLFGFRYRLEIYTPSHKRVHGYYVLPFLLGDRLVARVDLKSDRLTGTLRVQAAHIEENADAGEVAANLSAELTRLGEWLGLPRIAFGRRGRFTKVLRSAAVQMH